MNHSDQINELAAALAVAQSEIEGAVKGATNPHFRTKYADLGAVWDAIRDPFTRNGLSITQLPSSGPPNALALETVLMHKSGQWVSELFVMPVSKADPQGFGSAMTYARRYSLMAVAGISPVDDDAEGATDRKQPTKAGTFGTVAPTPRAVVIPVNKEDPKPEFTSDPPRNAKLRTMDDWKTILPQWRKNLDSIQTVKALNDWIQVLDEGHEISALVDAWPAAADKFNGEINLKRKVMAERETMMARA